MSETVFRLGELFCGPGGLALGASNAKIENPEYRIVHQWANDYDQSTCNTYIRNICPENPGKMNGAASIFYDEALAGLAEQVGTDLFILPSSVHECIAVSTEMGTPEMLAEMVQEVNGTQVSEEEQLSDHVYLFDARERKLSIADTSMEQLEAKVSEETAGYEAAQNQTEGMRPHRHR